MSARIRLNQSVNRLFESAGLPAPSAMSVQPGGRRIPPPGDTAVVESPSMRQTAPFPPMRVERPVEGATLSRFLQVGRTYHPLCRHAFLEKRTVGYYHYERRLEYRTCAVAAAYAGAFGPAAIERPDFSYSMAVWRLSQRIGVDLDRVHVYGPTGRCQPVAREMMQLVDEDYWTREGVAEWLASLGL